VAKAGRKGRLLELQADNAVIFYSNSQLQVGTEQTGTEEVLAKGAINSIYMVGDVLVTEGNPNHSSR